MPRALVSVSNKNQLYGFMKSLADIGWEIVSTGGTRKFLVDNKVPVLDVSTYTGFPEIMDGRVKTLHPRVHGGLLGRRDVPEDVEIMKLYDILPFDMVVCNLYPFESTIADPTKTFADAIENIDIGGPSMIRSAAKNHKFVLVVTDLADYQKVFDAVRSGSVTDALRLELAAKAFGLTSRYDHSIGSYLFRQVAS